MSVGDKVWLVTVTTEPAEETEGNPSLTGYFLHASREGAADGLRDPLAELGIEHRMRYHVADSHHHAYLGADVAGVAAGPLGRGGFITDVVLGGDRVDLHRMRAGRRSAPQFRPRRGPS